MNKLKHQTVKKLVLQSLWIAFVSVFILISNYIYWSFDTNWSRLGLLGVCLPVIQMLKYYTLKNSIKEIWKKK